MRPPSPSPAHRSRRLSRSEGKGSTEQANSAQELGEAPGLGPRRIGHANLASVFQKYQLLSSMGPGSWPDTRLALSNFRLMDTPKVSLLTAVCCCWSRLGAWHLAHWLPCPGLSHLHCRSKSGHTGIIIAANSNVALPSSHASLSIAHVMPSAIVRKGASPGSAGERRGWGRLPGAPIRPTLPLTFASSWAPLASG